MLVCDVVLYCVLFYRERPPFIVFAVVLCCIICCVGLCCFAGLFCFVSYCVALCVVALCRVVAGAGASPPPPPFVNKYGRRCWTSGIMERGREQGRGERGVV